MLPQEYLNLAQLFLDNTHAAIDYCESKLSILSNLSYSDFLVQNSNPKHLSTCQESWSTPRLSIHCNNCGISENSCICLNCYLKGDHTGHDLIIKNGLIGNCDCGDYALWKKEGFCREHFGQSENPEKEQVPEIFQQLVIVITKASFLNIVQISQNNPKAIMKITKFLKQIIQLGDGYRRCVSIGLSSESILENVIHHIPQFSKIVNSDIFGFFGSLINDSLFCSKFSNTAYPQN